MSWVDRGCLHVLARCAADGPTTAHDIAWVDDLHELHQQMPGRYGTFSSTLTISPGQVKHGNPAAEPYS